MSDVDTNRLDLSNRNHALVHALFKVARTDGKRAKPYSSTAFDRDFKSSQASIYKGRRVATEVQS